MYEIWRGPTYHIISSCQPLWLLQVSLPLLAVLNHYSSMFLPLSQLTAQAQHAALVWVLLKPPALEGMWQGCCQWTLHYESVHWCKKGLTTNQLNAKDDGAALLVFRCPVTATHLRGTYSASMSA